MITSTEVARLQDKKIIAALPHAPHMKASLFGLVILRSPLCSSFCVAGGAWLPWVCARRPLVASCHFREFTLVGIDLEWLSPCPSGRRSNFSLQLPSRKYFNYNNYYDGVREPGGPGVRGVGVQGGCG